MIEIKRPGIVSQVFMKDMITVQIRIHTECGKEDVYDIPLGNPIKETVNVQ